MASQTVGSTFANGARLPNFVNGRLLAAEDLATGQTTLLGRDTEVARAAGHGVVEGLWVTAGATSLSVAAGLGFPPAGEPVCLPAPVTLPLSSAATTAAPTGVGFANCTATPSGSENAVGPGAYLLTATPACQLQGSAPMAPTPGSDTPQACTAQWEVAGVTFSAIPLGVGTTVDGVEVTDGTRRNLVAHWCLGSEGLAQLPVELFSFDPAYAGLDQLAPDLGPCDLPLAVFWWAEGAVTFVDNWSARRRITRPDASTGMWPAVVGDRRQAEGEARFLQFQDQVAQLVTDGSSSSTVATDVFGVLPPAGFLPVAFDTGAKETLSLYSPAPTATATDTATPAGAPTGSGDSSAFTELSAGEVGTSSASGGGGTTTPGGGGGSGSSGSSGSSGAASDVAGEAARMLRITPNELSLWHTIGNQDTSAAQSGFMPSTFFGRLAQFGGFLAWDLAYTALRQSWFFTPVPTSLPTMTAVDREAEILHYEASLLTYYYVIENFRAALQAQQQGQRVPLYVVFIANEVWVPNTRPPVLLQFGVRG
jgi:uncharacterized membrane protein YgcG